MSIRRGMDTLTNYDELVEWGRKAGVITPQETNQLLREAQKRESESESVYQRGIELREAIYKIVVSHLRDEPASPDDINRFNRELELAHRYYQLIPTDGGYQLS